MWTIFQIKHYRIISYIFKQNNSIFRGLSNFRCTFSKSRRFSECTSIVKSKKSETSCLYSELHNSFIHTEFNFGWMNFRNFNTLFVIVINFFKSNISPKLYKFLNRIILYWEGRLIFLYTFCKLANFSERTFTVRKRKIWNFLFVFRIT